jgi:hypothetical protein
MSNNNSNSNLSASSSTGANEKPKLLYQEGKKLVPLKQEINLILQKPN